MEIDSFMEIGCGHKICEDYIIRGVKPFPYIIIADGCSSSENTDIGARILVQTVKKNLDAGKTNLSTILKRSIEQAAISVEILGLDLSSLDVTLGFLYVLNNIVYVQFEGDGNLLWVDKNNNLYIKNIIFEESAPYYLSYRLDSKRNKQYFKVLDCVFTKEINTSRNTEKYVADYIDIYNYYSWCKEIKEIKSIFITSDGIESFNQELFNVAKELTSFKNTKGEFLRRRCKKAFKILGSHYDDISIGGFIF